jgi:hypothetical protein
MNRLQLSFREEQASYLARRAERDGISMAEVVRRLVDAEAAAEAPHDVDGIWDIVGLIDQDVPLVDGIPVSEAPDLYLYGRPAASATSPARRSRR